MSFQDIADEGHYTSGAGWDNTYSESILEESDTYDERTFLDNVMERIDLDEEQYGFDNGRQLELRASNVLVSYGTERRGETRGDPTSLINMRSSPR